MLEELVAQPHCLHVYVDIWQLNMFKLNYGSESINYSIPLQFTASSWSIFYHYENLLMQYTENCLVVKN